MRKITANEELLIASFIQHPELIPGYTDLQRHHFSSEFPWIIYQQFIVSTMDHIQNNSPYIVGTELKAMDLITSEEFNHFQDDCGIAVATSFSAETAYNSLIETWDVIKIKDRVARVINQDLTSEEIKENIFTILGETTEKDSPMESIKSVKEHRESCEFNLGHNLRSLNWILDIEKTDLIILAARPFSGKTTLGVQFAVELTKFGKIHFWSMEMSKGRIKEKVDRYGDCKEENFMITNPARATIQKIYKKATQDRPVAIFIDQLNKIKSKGMSEYERMSRSAEDLKELASTLKIPIFCLAQINRSAGEGKPSMDELKGTGAIEEEADVVMLLHVVEKGKTRLYVDKNRTKNCSVGAFTLSFSTTSQIYDGCETFTPMPKGKNDE